VIELIRNHGRWKPRQAVVDAIVASPAWRGATVTVEADCTVLRHPQGAVARLRHWSEVEPPSPPHACGEGCVKKRTYTEHTHRVGECSKAPESRRLRCHGTRKEKGCGRANYWLVPEDESDDATELRLHCPSCGVTRNHRGR